MGKFKIGDKVQFIGDAHKHIYEEKLQEVFDDNIILTISGIDWAGDYMVSGFEWTFSEDELKLAEPMLEVINNIIESIVYDRETQTHNHDITFDGNISDLCSYETTSNYDTTMYVDKKTNELKIKENKNMRILDIYRNEAMIKIEENYNSLIEKIKAKDKVQKLIEETENQINVILDKDENDAVCLGNRGLLEPKNKEEIRDLIDSKHAEWKKLDVMLEKVVARLEICDDDEFSKVEVLKLYNILDDDGKIAEYKIEKKGKK